MSTITDTTIDPEVTDSADLAPDLTDTASVPVTETATATAKAEQAIAALPAPSAAELLSISVEDLVPHPDNPRTSLGDLDELARSIKAHGVLQPLVVLPSGDEGKHLIVTGHRRHAAAIKAKTTHVPAVIRELNPAEVVEAMLIENVNRSDLTVSEEVRAIERLMDLAEGKLTPTKLCKRIGRSQAWVRARMAVCALPAKWRTALDDGDLSLAAGEAAASVADLGPEHVDELCEQFARSPWGDHGHRAIQHRQAFERQAAFDAAVAKARGRRGAVVFTHEDRPRGHAIMSSLDPEVVKGHGKQPCHAVLIERTTYGKGFEQTAICTDPRSHVAVEPDGSGGGDGLAGDGSFDGERGDGFSPPGQPPAPSGSSGPDLDSSHLRRKSRVARKAFTREVFARSRGGISQTQATRIALRALIYEAGMEALNFAAEVLGIEDTADYYLTDRLITEATTPAELVRIAGAVAMGMAESRMYHGYNATHCRDYLAALTGAGWDPDIWTAAIIDRLAKEDEAEQAKAEADDTATTDDSEDEPAGPPSSEDDEAEPDGTGTDSPGTEPAPAGDADPTDQDGTGTDADTPNSPVDADGDPVGADGDGADHEVASDEEPAESVTS
jgi:ParB/RepB/Spo0J family partition protein